MPSTSLNCSHCKQPMTAVALEGHYGQRIEIDSCGHCQLLWIDDFESVRLSGLGWIALLRHIHAESTSAAHTAASARAHGLQLPLSCMRCANSLTPVRNLTRFGRTAAHECPLKHGYFQTFSLLLAERGLVRPLNSRDRKTLVAENREAACMHCGAAIAARTGAGAGAAESCSHCASPLIVLDLQRLMASVMVRHALPLPADDGQLASWSCRACGDSVDPTRMTRCERCAHEVVAPSLADALPLLLALEPLLQGMRAPGAQPLGERLRRQRGYASTAFFRHLVRPFTAGVQQQFEHLEWYSWRTGSTLLIALWLAWLWWR